MPRIIVNRMRCDPDGCVRRFARSSRGGESSTLIVLIVLIESVLVLIESVLVLIVLIELIRFSLPSPKTPPLPTSLLPKGIRNSQSIGS